MLTYKLTNKGKNMKTLRNMLFAMLVSPLVFYSAQAGEITLDGSLEVASTKQDGETGNPIGLENEMTLSASTELDNGFSVGYKMTLDADAFDDEELSFGTDYGTIAFTSAGAPMDAVDNITPTAFEEAEYAASTGYVDTSLFSGDGDMAIRYTNSFFGWSVDAMHTPRFSSGDGSDDGSPTGTTDDEFGEVNEIVVAGNPLAIAGIDGVKLTLGYSMVDKTLANQEDVEQGTAAVNYSYGPLSVGVQKSIIYYGNNGKGAVAAANWAKNQSIGAAYAVNDNLSISYQETESYKSTTAVASSATGVRLSDSVRLEADTWSVAYTLGGLSIKYADSEVSNDAYTVASKSDKTTLSIGVAY